MSKKIDQISDANILKTDFKTQNQFSNALGSIVSGDVGSSQNKNLLIYIKNLLRDYIKERYKGKESDVYLINKELIKKFRDDFSDFINQYQEAVDTNIDLEAIIKKETEKVDKKIVTEIKSIITTVLKRKLKEHIKNNTDGKKTKEIREIINSYNLRDLNSVEIENIINRTLTNDHAIIKQIKSEFKDTIKAVNIKHNLPAINNNSIFISKKLNKIVNKSANKLSQITFKLFKYKKQPPKIQYSGGMKFLIGTVKAFKITKTVITKFIKLTSKVFNFIGKVFKFIKRLLNFVKIMTKVVTGTVLNLAKYLIIKPIKILIIKPLTFMVSKLFSFVGVITKSLLKLIKIPLNLIKKVLSVVSDTLKSTLKASKFVLLTPQGMYALGFLLGFLWKKLEYTIKEIKIDLIDDKKIDKIIPDVTKHLSKFIDSLYNFIDKIVGVIDDVLKPIDEYLNNLGLEKYPVFRRMRLDMIEYWDRILTDGLFKTILNMEPIKSIIDFINDSGILTLIQDVYECAKNFGDWLFKNQEIAEFLLGTSRTYSTAQTLKNIFGKFSHTKFKGIFGGLIGSIAAYTTSSITESILDSFESADDKGLNFYSDNSGVKSTILASYQQNKILQIDQYSKLIDNVQKDVHSLYKIRGTIGVISSIINNPDVEKDSITLNRMTLGIDTIINQMGIKYIRNFDFLKSGDGDTNLKIRIDTIDNILNNINKVMTTLNLNSDKIDSLLSGVNLDSVYGFQSIQDNYYNSKEFGEFKGNQEKFNFSIPFSPIQIYDDEDKGQYRLPKKLKVQLPFIEGSNIIDAIGNPRLLNQMEQLLVSKNVLDNSEMHITRQIIGSFSNEDFQKFLRKEFNPLTREFEYQINDEFIKMFKEKYNEKHEELKNTSFGVLNIYIEETIKLIENNLKLIKESGDKIYQYKIDNFRKELNGIKQSVENNE